MYDLRVAYFFASIRSRDFFSNEDFTILKECVFDVRGISIEANIIGESHLINIPDLSYQETIAHSAFLKDKSLLTLDISNSFLSNLRTRFCFENDHASFDVKIELTNKANTNYTNGKGCVLSKEFDNGAISSVALADNKNEIIISTLHSYPEYKKSLTSETIIHLK